MCVDGIQRNDIKKSKETSNICDNRFIWFVLILLITSGTYYVFIKPKFVHPTDGHLRTEPHSNSRTDEFEQPINNRENGLNKQGNKSKLDSFQTDSKNATIPTGSDIHVEFGTISVSETGNFDTALKGVPSTFIKDGLGLQHKASKDISRETTTKSQLEHPDSGSEQSVPEQSGLIYHANIKTNSAEDSRKEQQIQNKSVTLSTFEKGDYQQIPRPVNHPITPPSFEKYDYQQKTVTPSSFEKNEYQQIPRPDPIPVTKGLTAVKDSSSNSQESPTKAKSLHDIAAELANKWFLISAKEHVVETEKLKVSNQQDVREVTFESSPSPKGKGNHLDQDMDKPSLLLDIAREVAKQYLNSEHAADNPSGKTKEVQELSVTNIDQLQKPRYLPNYKNPCWIQKLSHGAEDIEQFLCLPFFFLTGMPRCGTTDVYARLSRHPDVSPAQKNSPDWWAQDYTLSKSTFLNYILHFKDAINVIKTKARSAEQVGQLYHKQVFFDANPDTFWKGKVESIEIENGIPQFKFRTPGNIHKLLPDAKIILLVRNPADRLYSDFYTLAENNSPEAFHEFVTSSINTFEYCLSQRHPLKVCVHRDLSNSNSAHLETGIYEVFVEEWLQYFHDQLLIIRLEDYSKDRPYWLGQIFNFVGLDVTEREIFFSAKLQNLPETEYARPMLVETRRLLRDFYLPYNMRLGEILNNKIFEYREEDEIYR